MGGTLGGNGAALPPPPAAAGIQGGSEQTGGSPFSWFPRDEGGADGRAFVFENEFCLEGMRIIRGCVFLSSGT